MLKRVGKIVVPDKDVEDRQPDETPVLSSSFAQFVDLSKVTETFSEWQCTLNKIVQHRTHVLQDSMEKPREALNEHTSSIPEMKEDSMQDYIKATNAVVLSKKVTALDKLTVQVKEATKAMGLHIEMDTSDKALTKGKTQLAMAACAAILTNKRLAKGAPGLLSQLSATQDLISENNLEIPDFLAEQITKALSDKSQQAPANSAGQ